VKRAGSVPLVRFVVGAVLLVRADRVSE